MKSVAVAVAVAVSLGLIACGLVAESGERESDRRSPVLDAASDVRADAEVVVADAASATDSAPPGPACAALGGTCVGGRAANCPAGTQPAEDIHADCMPATASRGHFCCVPAPPSPCADAEGHLDCFAKECETCWMASAAPITSTCAAGRTCCAYACPD